MYDSLNPQPFPTWQIPITFTIDGAAQAGYLRPVDNEEPPCTYMVVVDKKWLGTLHYFSQEGWFFGSKEIGN